MQRNLKNNYLNIKYFILLSIFLVPGFLFSQELEDRFNYSGDMIVQGFFIGRDVPLNRPEDLGLEDSDTGSALGFPYDSVCDRPDWFDDDQTRAAIDSRCSEQDDYYRTRLRLSASFKPSDFVEIVYGLEVGFLTFGRESDVYGPGSGGKGSGRTNLETQKLYMDVHNEDRSAFIRTGIMSYSTPEGIVLAGSGAGVLGALELPEFDSYLEGLVVRSEDNSWVDNDSNGFSDSNYSDTHLAMARWKWSGIANLHTEFYGLYKADSDAGSYKLEETSKLYWAGLYSSLRQGPVTFVFHIIGNGGDFHRVNTFEDAPAITRPWINSQLATHGYKSFDLSTLSNTAVLDYLNATGSTGPYYDAFYRQLPRKRHKVAGGAAHVELNYRATDRISIILSAAAGSGRADPYEPDGSSSDFRHDQFRTAGSAFQFSEIGVDSSGGYSLFPGGSLTGIMAKGLYAKVQAFENLEVGAGYYSFRLLHDPVLTYNAYYTAYPVYTRAMYDSSAYPYLVLDYQTRFTSHPGFRKPSRYLGEEVDLRFAWKLWSGFSVSGYAAWFDVGDGLRAIKDMEYGDDLYEVSFSVKQSI